jgi:hypothetical protein
MRAGFVIFVPMTNLRQIEQDEARLLIEQYFARQIFITGVVRLPEWDTTIHMEQPENRKFERYSFGYLLEKAYKLQEIKAAETGS